MLATKINITIRKNINIKLISTIIKRKIIVFKTAQIQKSQKANINLDSLCASDKYC